MRRAGKRDSNHAEIVKALRDLGCSVLDLGAVGHGCPDILVGVAGVNYLLEIKDGRKPPSERKLTPDQVDWHRVWKGQALVVTNVLEAAQAVGKVSV